MLDNGEKKRYGIFDMLRGLALVSMILYHAAWDISYFNVSFSWLDSAVAELWQLSICMLFIVLSGFCWGMGKKPLRRGLTVLAAGAVITAATLLIIPSERIVFGILTFTGTAMLLMIPLEKLLKRVNWVAGLAASFAMFAFTYGVNEGNLGFFGASLVNVPNVLYNGYAMTFLGFTMPEFYSSDYFSLFPWIFLYILGYFVYRAFCEENKWERLGSCSFAVKGIRPLNFLGRHSLIVYLVHQPIVFGTMTLINEAIN